MACDWECHVCGGHAVNRMRYEVLAPDGLLMYWYGIWYCDAHVVDGCERMA